MQLILNTTGMSASKKNNCFCLEYRDIIKLINPKRVSSILVTCNMNFSTAAIELAIKNEIPIMIMSRNGKLLGTISSHHYKGITTTRRNQAQFAYSTDATAFICKIFTLKTDEQNKNVKWLAKYANLNREFAVRWNNAMRILNKLVHYENQTIKSCYNHILGIEGIITKTYWEIVANSVGKKYNFQKRTRRPSEDNFNCILNYGYGMLYGMVERAVVSVGLDPYFGILHTDEYAKKTLTFDIIEPFRPWIDKLIIRLLDDGVVKSDNFDKNKASVTLNKSGKSIVIPIFINYMNERVSFDSQIKTRYNHILALSSKLVKTINRAFQ